MISKIPNLFIIGSPKCATTALSDTLAKHPKIFFSHPKEPNFFNDDFSKEHRRFKDLEQYLKVCFKDYQNEPIAAEGTVWYLYSKTAVSNIQKINPEAKFIVVIREHAEMLYSLHSTLLRSAQENIKSFEKAWEITKTKGSNRKIPVTCRDRKLLMYNEIGMQGKHIKKLYQIVDRKNVLVLNFNEVTNEQEKTLKQIFEFLKIKSGNLNEIEKANSNQEVKFQFLSYLMGEIGRSNNLYKLKRYIGIPKGSKFIRAIQSLNLKNKERQPLNQKIKFDISDYFQEDKDILTKLLGEDKIYW